MYIFSPATKVCPNCKTSAHFEHEMLPYSKCDTAPFRIEVALKCTSCGYMGVETWYLSFNRLTSNWKPKPVAIRPSVPMHKVKSSVIDEIGYNPASMELFIKFHTGDTVYGYKGFYATRFVEFLNAPSLGKFYAQEIKGKYDRLS